jgi:signal transduction histidine kinase/CheY-like chemotaxis protein
MAQPTFVKQLLDRTRLAIAPRIASVTVGGEEVTARPPLLALALLLVLAAVTLNSLIRLPITLSLRVFIEGLLIGLILAGIALVLHQSLSPRVLLQFTLITLTPALANIVIANYGIGSPLALLALLAPAAALFCEPHTLLRATLLYTGLAVLSISTAATLLQITVATSETAVLFQDIIGAVCCLTFLTISYFQRQIQAEQQRSAHLFLSARRRAREMAILADVGRDISVSLDVNIVLERITSYAQNLLHAETSAVFLPNSDTTAFRATIVLGRYAEEIQATTVGIGDGIIGDLARRGVAELLTDAAHDPRARQIPGTLAQEHNQLMVAPLQAGGNVLGMLTVWRYHQHDIFTNADLEFLIRLSRQAAIAVQNARLFAAAEAARAAAEAANRAKSTFLANMSHELRTPLNAVLGFTQLMERDPALPDHQRGHLGIIARSGEHLLSLINDVLELSKIEAGHATLHDAIFDLQQLLHNVEDLFRLRAEAKGLQLSVEADALPRYVTGDEGKLRQILINLLGNAVKFTHEGGVIVRAAYAHGQFVAEVADSGEGIEADQIPTLFEAFVQTSSGARVHEGAGLGLAITRQFVELMGGTIEVRSEVGAGSVFRFTVRLAPSTATGSPSTTSLQRVVGIAPASHGDYRMLVVDDKWENRQLMVEWLQAVGFQVRTAANGREALEVWEQWEPQLIWMDMRMPIMDGYAATRQIKRTLKGQATVVIALSASAFEHEQSIVLAAGCDDFVRKPVREATIFAKITEHLGVEFIYEPAAASAAVQATSVQIDATALGCLPSDVRAALRQAAEEYDPKMVSAAIKQIEALDPALAHGLNDLLARYAFDQIETLVHEGEQRP